MARKKGQTAMEYLLSYSWVILVVLIGGIALWKMGVFTPQVPERGKVGFSGIDMVGWAAFTTDQLFMSIKNDVGVDVRVPMGGIIADIGAIKCDKAAIRPKTLRFRRGRLQRWLRTVQVQRAFPRSTKSANTMRVRSRLNT